MDQDATWYGGISLGQGDIVLDGDPAPHRNGHSSLSSTRLLDPLYSGTVAHLSNR